MRYGIFSDVHSNLEAFNVALDFYKKETIDKFIYLGDIVGYAANPNECTQLLKNLNPICVAGNHDWAAVDKFSASSFNIYAKEAIVWTKNELTKENSLYLRNLKLKYEENDFVCVHGSLINPGMFNYVLDSNDAYLCLGELNKQICFIGHSHRMEVYCLKEDKISCSREYEIKLQENCKYIVNVGSVGQPRDRDPRLCLSIYDSQDKVVKFIRLDYNIKQAAEKILEKNLPPMLAGRLYLGQ